MCRRLAGEPEAQGERVERARQRAGRVEPAGLGRPNVEPVQQGRQQRAGGEQHQIPTGASGGTRTERHQRGLCAARPSSQISGSNGRRRAARSSRWKNGVKTSTVVPARPQEVSSTVSRSSAGVVGHRRTESSTHARRYSSCCGCARSTPSSSARARSAAAGCPAKSASVRKVTMPAASNANSQCATWSSGRIPGAGPRRGDHRGQAARLGPFQVLAQPVVEPRPELVAARAGVGPVRGASQLSRASVSASSSRAP